jgi:hypothetical protein
MTEMLKWTKVKAIVLFFFDIFYSHAFFGLQDSIRQPLIMLNKELYKDALKCFKLIQMVMGDRSRPRHSNEIEDIQNILTCGITKGQMRDEIYVQVCKQLHNNPSG